MELLGISILVKRMNEDSLDILEIQWKLYKS